MLFVQCPMILSTICASEPDVSMCRCQVITANDHLLLKHFHPPLLLCLHVIQCVARQFLSFSILVLFFCVFPERELLQQPSETVVIFVLQDSGCIQSFLSTRDPDINCGSGREAACEIVVIFLRGLHVTLTPSGRFFRNSRPYAHFPLVALRHEAAGSVIDNLLETN